jgi:RNA polymerase sigma-70 factor (ECF subfamily)
VEAEMTMSLPETRHSLLVRLRDTADQAAWQQFAELYEPAILRLARRQGLQHADAADLTQHVLLAVARSIARWDADPAKGRFRGWLYRVARNLALDALRQRSRTTLATGDSAVARLLNQQPENDGSTAFDLEYRRQAFLAAAERIRGEFQAATWQAFWRTAVEGQPIVDASKRLGLSVGAVYAARSRVLARLREAVQESLREIEGEDRAP